MARIRRDIDRRFAQMSARQLTDYIHTKGKAANTRLRELEKTKHGGLYKSSSAYQYVIERERAERERGQNVIYSRTKGGQVKFKTSTRNVEVKELMERATQISRFLEARTSTVTGTKAAYEQAYKTWKEKHENEDIPKTEWFGFWRSAVIQNFKEQYGSEELYTLMSYADKYNLSVSEIEEMLKSVGFDERTNFEENNVIPLKDIYDAIERKRKFR